ncbi:MAG: tandem-95 repeat protein, partial [Candidatus Kariarchaeaceae archaeon]
SPDADWYGIDSFTYQIFDGTDWSAIATVTLTVNSVNDAPVAVDEEYTINEDNSLIVPTPGVLTNDYDVDGDVLTAELLSGAWGVTSLAPDGWFSFGPFVNWYGTTSFTYRVFDGVTYSNVATVTIHVLSVNDAPVAVEDAYTTDEDTPLIVAAPGFLTNDYDVDGDLIDVLFADVPSHGTLSFTADGAFTYSPNENWYGIDTFTYQISDGVDTSNVVTVTLTVNSVNDVPQANDDFYDVETNTVLNVVVPGALVNDYDIEMDPLIAIVVSFPSNGVLDLIQDGSFVYTPNARWFGTDSFTYRVEDIHGSADEALVTITVWDNTPPVTSSSLQPKYPTGENNWYVGPVELSLIASDFGSGVLKTNYRINGGPISVYTTAVLFTLDDVYNIEFWSVDNAGNIEMTNSVDFQIDQNYPISTLDIWPLPPSSNPRPVSTYTDFILDATDSLSGVYKTEYQIDSNGWNLYETPFNVIDIGFHTVYYRSIDNAGNVEPTQSVKIVVSATELVYTGEVSGNYSDPVFLEARLIDVATQLPIAGKTILFEVDDQSGFAVTDLSGYATITLILNQPSGIYTVSASFTGDSEYLSDMVTNNFVIYKETATPTYTGTTISATTSTEITLRSTVFDDDDGNWGDLSQATVSFFIYSVPIDPSNPLLVISSVSVGPTTVPGVGVAMIDIPNLTEGGYIVYIQFEPSLNNYYTGLWSDAVILTVYEPTGDFVTGGGWIEDPSGSKGNFGFNVKYNKNGFPKGQSIYVYRVDNWEIIIKSNKWNGMAMNENHAFFEAKCVVQMFDSETGELMWAEGNYQFRVDVWDNEEGPDVYQIRIYDKDGLVYHEAGFDPLGYLGGGNIAIHQEK